MAKKEPYKVEYFYYWADKYRRLLIEEAEIEKNDHSSVFIEKLALAAKKGGLINMNINGLPTMGKSTKGMKIVNELMKKLYGRSMRVQDIDRDQNEFFKSMMNPELKHTIRLIDEWNEAEDSGENSSVIKKATNTISDVQAQRMVHKVACSPKDNPDKNAWLTLEIFSVDKNRKTITSKIYYKMFVGGCEYNQLIGMVTLSVKDILEKKWYKEYRRRKMEKMEIMTREGIFQPRKLDMAEVILNVVKEIKPLADMQTIVNPNLVRNVVKSEMRKAKMPLSIVGEELATREAMGILDVYKQYSKIITELKKQRNKLGGRKITIEEYSNNEKKLKMMSGKLLKMIQLQETELEHYKQIKEKYETILET